MMFGVNVGNFTRLPVENCRTEPATGTNDARFSGLNGWSTENVHVPSDGRLSPWTASSCAPAPNFHVCVPVVIDMSSRSSREICLVEKLALVPHEGLGNVYAALSGAERWGGLSNRSSCGSTPGGCCRKW